MVIKDRTFHQLAGLVTVDRLRRNRDWTQADGRINSRKVVKAGVVRVMRWLVVLGLVAVRGMS
jgi:hypothetical protein